MRNDLETLVARKQIMELLQRANEALQAQRSEDGLRLARSAEGIATKHLEPTDRELVLARSRLGAALVQSGDYDGARATFMTILPDAEAALGTRDPELPILLNNFSVVLFRLGRAGEAIPVMTRVVDLKREIHHKGSVEYLLNLEDLFSALEAEDRLADTAPYVSEAATIVAGALGPDSPEHRYLQRRLARLAGSVNEQTSKVPEETTLFDQARRAYASGDFEAAQLLHRQLLAELPPQVLPGFITEVVGNMFDPFMNHLNELEARARAEDDAGDLDCAARTFRQIVEICRVSYGHEHMRVAFALNSLGLERHKAGAHEEAKAHYAEALRLLGHPQKPPDEVETIHMNLAALFMKICDVRAPASGGDLEHWQSMPQGYARAVRFRLPVGTEDAGPVGSASQWLLARTAVYESAADPVRVRFLYEAVLELTRIAYGDVSGALLQPLAEFARFCTRQADFVRAVSLIEETTRIAHVVLAPDSLALVEVCRDKARLLAEVGDLPGSERAIRRAIEIARTATYSHALQLLDDDLATILLKQGKRAEARDVLNRVVARAEELELDVEEMQRLATFLMEAGDLARAEALFRRALARQQEEIGRWDPRHALTLSNLGTLLSSTGRFDEAERAIRSALEIRRAEFGSTHVSVGGTASRLALTLAELGRGGEAWAFVREALAIGDRLIADMSSVSSHRHLCELLKEERKSLDLALSIASGLLSEDTAVAHEAYDVILRRKSLSAESLSGRRLPILRGRYPGLQERLLELDQLKRAAVSSIIGSSPVADLDQVTELRDRIEAELATSIPELHLGRLFSTATLEAVANALPEGSVLLEYVRFTPAAFVGRGGEDRDARSRYLLFALHSGEPASLRLLDLGEAVAIDATATRFVESVGRGATRFLDIGTAPPDVTGGRDAGTKLRDRAWDPVVPHLRGKTRIFIAPDATLALVPFDLLPTAEGGALLDVYTIGFVGAGREVLRFRERPDVRRTDPVVLAGPDFESATSAHAEQEAPAVDSVRGSLESLRTRGLRFPSLPGARAEGEALVQLLDRATLFTGADAAAWRVRDLTSPVVLHLATHGFYVPRDEAPDDFVVTSGVVFAGVNRWLARDCPVGSGGETGILTSEDVSTLRLLETELVVLSSCRSGVGDLVHGEGVFGLRRAFAAAGARAIVVSLWKVPDEETKELMLEFYRHLRDGCAKPDAMRNAKLTLRTRNPDPFYWGGFICDGDWNAIPSSVFRAT